MNEAPKRSSIRTWALVATAVTSAALIGAAYWIIAVMSSREWCSQAAGVAKYALDVTKARSPLADSAADCFRLMTGQIDWLGWTLIVSVGVLALCLLCLVVIVLTGGRLSFRASREGVETDIGRDPAIRDGDEVTVHKEI